MTTVDHDSGHSPENNISEEFRPIIEDLLQGRFERTDLSAPERLQIALHFVENNQAHLIFENKAFLDGVDLSDILPKLMEALQKTGQIWCIVNHLDFFPELNRKELALAIIREGKVAVVNANYEQYFRGVDPIEIGQALIEEGCVELAERFFQGDEVAFSRAVAQADRILFFNEARIRKLEKMDPAAMVLLVENSWNPFVLGEKVDSYDFQSALRLVQLNYSNFVLQEIENGKVRDVDLGLLASALLKAGNISLVLTSPIFKPFNLQPFIMECISEGQGAAIVCFIKAEKEFNSSRTKEGIDFYERGLDHLAIFSALIEVGFGLDLVGQLSGEEGEKPLVLSLVVKGYGKTILENTSIKIDSEIALALIDQGLAKEIYSNLERINQPNSKVAVALVEAGFGKLILDSLEVIHQPNTQLAVALVQKNIIPNPDSLVCFVDLDHQALAYALFSSGEINVLRQDDYKEFFEGRVNLPGIAVEALKNKNISKLVDLVYFLISCRGNEADFPFREIFLAIIGDGRAREVMEIVSHLTSPELRQVTCEQVIGAGGVDDFINHSKKLTDLDWAKIELLMTTIKEGEKLKDLKTRSVNYATWKNAQGTSG